MIDLDRRGLLDETLVVLLSEHGRTPKLALGAGRRPRPLVALLLGRDGRRRRGPRPRRGHSPTRSPATPLERPVSPKDILATIYHLLGIDPATTLTDQSGPAMAADPRGRGHPRSPGVIDDSAAPSGEAARRRRSPSLWPSVEPYIDAHSHIWTPDVAHYPLAPGFKVADMQPPSFTAEELLATCRPAGVGRVNLIQMSYYEFDNRYMLDMIKLYPDRFVGTAIVDPLAAEPGRAMRELAPAGRACLPHPAAVQQAAAGPLAGAGGLRGDVRHRRADRPGPLLPDRSRRLPRGGPHVPADSPRPRVIIDHLGRIGAGPDGAIRDAEVEALCALAKHPNSTSRSGPSTPWARRRPPTLDLAPLIRPSWQAFGARRCMWESDCPFQVVKRSLHRQPGPDPRPSRFPDQGRPRLAPVPDRGAGPLRPVEIEAGAVRRSPPATGSPVATRLRLTGSRPKAKIHGGLSSCEDEDSSRPDRWDGEGLLG